MNYTVDKPSRNKSIRLKRKKKLKTVQTKFEFDIPINTLNHETHLKIQLSSSRQNFASLFTMTMIITTAKSFLADLFIDHRMGM